MLTRTLSICVALALMPTAFAQTTRPASTQPAATQPARTANPAADGFDHENSDPRAIELADEVMHAMGGRESWEMTRHLTWNFFGTRRHVWNRQTGDVRIEYTDRQTEDRIVILMNIKTDEGRAWRGDDEIVEAEARAAMLRTGKTAWINDSYWMFMPYKLKDSGVTLKYKGEAELPDGRAADVITLTFSEVGNTPNNKYDVYIARDTKLVEQWSFYRNAEDDTPGFTTPWGNWQKHGRILLSDDRGPNRRHTDIAVFHELPRRVYTDPAPVDIMSMDRRDVW